MDNGMDDWADRNEDESEDEEEIRKGTHVWDSYSKNIF